MITKKMITKITSRFVEAGLDGNGRFEKPESGYVTALDILAEFGIELDEVVHSWSFRRKQGMQQIYLAWRNEEDSFSPDPIENTMLVISWYELRPGAFEVLGYMS